MQRRTACHAHLLFVYFLSLLSKTWLAAIAKICCFCGLIAPKPYVPQQNSLVKGKSLVYQQFPKMIPITWNCAIWAVPLAQTPPQNYPFSVVFGTCKTPCAEIQKFFNSSIHVFYFKNAQNHFGQKSALYWWQNKYKTLFAVIRWNP